MHFTFVESILAGLNLQNPSLEALQTDTNLYHAFIYQHKGVLSASATNFSNQDQNEAQSKFAGIIQLASTGNSSLVLTPEYSCPWSVIRGVLDQTLQHPNVGKLWIMGCESITVQQLRALKAELETDSVKIIFDETVFNRAGNFLDPACYIFKTLSNNGESVLVCLVQFKTQHMGVWSNSIERDNYIPGENLYIFRNDPESIYLFTLICSEALNFTPSAAFIAETGNRWVTIPYIIINLQLNPAPNHQEFRDFRRRTLNFDRKEIISVNWASGSAVQIGQANLQLNEFPRSGFYTDIDGINLDSDVEFIENHSNGLYYTFQKPKFHIFHLNGSIEAFTIQNSKPSQGVAPHALRRRTGPRVVQCHKFSNDYALEITTDINDGLEAFLNLKGSTNTVLRGNALTSLQKERLVSLSAGEIEYKEGYSWYRIDKIRPCILDENGVICRFTFAQDNDGNNFRTEFLDKIDRLNLIVQNAASIPDALSFLRDNCQEINFYRQGDRIFYNFNLVARDGTGKATGAYCGRLAKEEVAKKFNNLTRLFSQDDQSRKRVVTWYEPQLGVLDSMVDSKPPSIRDDHSTDPDSIKKD